MMPADTGAVSTGCSLDSTTSMCIGIPNSCSSYANDMTACLNAGCFFENGSVVSPIIKQGIVSTYLRKAQVSEPQTSQVSSTTSTPATSEHKPHVASNRQGTASTDQCTIKVTLTHDFYPDETFWAIKNQQGQIVAYYQGPYENGEFTTVVRNVPVSPGNYLFEITDTEADGICCDSGEGSFSVQVDGKTLFSGGSFGASWSKWFVVECSGTTTSTSPTTPASSTHSSSTSSTPSGACLEEKSAAVKCATTEACYSCFDNVMAMEIYPEDCDAATNKFCDAIAVCKNDCGLCMDKMIAVVDCQINDAGAYGECKLSCQEKEEEEDSKDMAGVYAGVSCAGAFVLALIRTIYELRKKKKPTSETTSDATSATTDSKPPVPSQPPNASHPNKPTLQKDDSSSHFDL